MNDRIRTLTALAAQPWWVSLSLTIAMMVIYFGFILLIAYNKPLLSTIVVPGLSLGILLGALIIVSAWVLIYLSPTIQVTILHHESAWFPLKNPGLVTIPLSFAVGIIVSLLKPKRRAADGFDKVEHRIHADWEI